MNLDQKKIPVVIIISSTILLIYSTFAKSLNGSVPRGQLKYYNRYFEGNIPLKHYVVDIFFLDIPYLIIMIGCLILIGIAIYTLLYKTDSEIIQLKGDMMKLSPSINTNKKPRFKMPKVSIKQLLGVVIPIAIVFALVYYLNLIQGLNRPLTMFEAFISSYGSTVLIILVIYVVIYAGQKIIGR